VKNDIAKDPGIIDDDIDLAEFADGKVDHRLGLIRVRDGPEIRNGFATRGLDLADDSRRRTVRLVVEALQ
jgi:hypothetical protein